MTVVKISQGRKKDRRLSGEGLPARRAGCLVLRASLRFTFCSPWEMPLTTAECTLGPIRSLYHMELYWILLPLLFSSEALPRSQSGVSFLCVTWEVQGQHLVTLRKPSGVPLFLGSEIIFPRGKSPKHRSCDY